MEANEAGASDEAASGTDDDEKDENAQEGENPEAA